MSDRLATNHEPAIVTHVCTRCGSGIEVLDLAGIQVQWRGKYSTVEYRGDTRYLCHPCRLALTPLDEREDLAAFFKRFLAIRDRLDIPADVTLHLLEGRGRNDNSLGRDFRLALFGIQVRHWRTTSPIPYLSIPGRSGSPEIAFAFPQIAIQRIGIAAALECRWSTKDPNSPATALEIVNWRGEVRLSELHKLLDGLALLRDFPPAGGRRKDVSRQIDPETFAVEMPRVYAKHLDQYGNHPTHLEVAAGLALSSSTFERYLRRYKDDKGPWPPVSVFDHY